MNFHNLFRVASEVGNAVGKGKMLSCGFACGGRDDHKSI